MTFEVYGADIGFIGYVEAKTERGAKIIARRLWPEIASFTVNAG